MIKQCRKKIISYDLTVLVLGILFCFLNTNTSQSQWVHCGLDQDYVYSLLSVGNKIFAGTDTLGIFYSTNNGANWVQSSLNNRTIGAMSLAGNYIFAGTEYFGVFRSSDFGTSWTPTSLNNKSVRTFAVNSNSVYAGTIINGVFVSTNLGVNWTQHNLNYRDVLSATVNANNIFAGTNSGLMKSTDNGMNWEPTSLVNVQIPSIISYNYVLYASVFSNPLDSGKIFRSINNGLNWEQTSFNSVCYALTILISGNYFFVGCIGDGFYLSTNNGITWSQHNEGFTLPIGINSLCLSSNWLIAATASHGVWRRDLNELIGIKKISSEVPTHFALSQNYSNPFNPTTTIEFDIPFDGVGHRHAYDLRLDVYSLTGQLVATLVNEGLSPGKYKVDWNASNYSSGIYFYKLMVSGAEPYGGFSETKKMVLIK